VLSITRVAESASHVSLKLEGQIVSEWVSLPERECLTWLQEKRRVILDVSEVTFIDRRGLEMLRRLISPFLQIINTPALIEELLHRGGKEGNAPDERAYAGGAVTLSTHTTGAAEGCRRSCAGGWSPHGTDVPYTLYRTGGSHAGRPRRSP
jgi:hypothetical protein